MFVGFSLMHLNVHKTIHLLPELKALLLFGCSVLVLFGCDHDEIEQIDIIILLYVCSGFMNELQYAIESCLTFTIIIIIIIKI